jgi:metal-responsive CopG/Arc/MetJ family transcriptional regulator
MKTIKTAVSLPTETYLKAEKLRKTLGKSRSEMVADALAALIKTVETREKEAQDNAAYARNPETPEEIAEAMAVTEEAWKQFGEDWTEEYNATR